MAVSVVGALIFVEVLDAFFYELVIRFPADDWWDGLRASYLTRSIAIGTPDRGLSFDQTASSGIVPGWQVGSGLTRLPGCLLCLIPVELHIPAGSRLITRMVMSSTWEAVARKAATACRIRSAASFAR